MTLTWATGTHAGRVRAGNEDRVFPEAGGSTSDRLLIAVADGMGGHVAGEVASSVALAAAVEADGSAGERISSGNQAVIAESLSRPELRGMGTTITLADIRADGTMVIGHVGDSRAYLIREGTITQLTRDHTVVAEYVATGKLDPSDVANHPQRSVLTRAVGLTDDLVIDELQERLAAGDRLILCSDGLNTMVDDEEILRIASTGKAEATVWALIEAANQAGGHDNITVAVIDCSA